VDVNNRVALVGAGLIGRSWATVFAAGGFEVALYDVGLDVAEKARALVAQGLDDLAAQGLLNDPQSAAARVRLAADLADALDGATLVQESLPERIEVKRAVFSELDRLAAPEAILASSTSTIVASRFTEELKGRHRCLVAHPVNPPHLIPLVELVGAPWTAPAVIAKAKAIYETVGQAPIIVRREIEGFVLNRLQAVLLSEAFRLVGNGYVTPQGLDKTLKDGLGLRWSFMGPFETIELNAPGGIPDYCRRYGESLSALSAADPSIYEGDSLARILSQWGESSDTRGGRRTHALARPPACRAQGAQACPTSRLIFCRSS
jgi:3-hydroxyacyl-CoA dehydrogenase